VSVAVILAVATVLFVNESDPPAVEQPVQPVAQGLAGVDDLATRPELLAQDSASYDGDLMQVPQGGVVDSSTAAPGSNAISAIEARGIAFADEWTISGYYGQPEAGSLTESHLPMANNQLR
jgi:hypothetical protein